MNKIKRGLLLTAVVACLFMAVGCDKEEPPSTGSESAVDTIADVTESGSDTEDTITTETETETETEPENRPAPRPRVWRVGDRYRTNLHSRWNAGARL